jgi:hypothetical protein
LSLAEVAVALAYLELAMVARVARVVSEAVRFL